MYEELAQTINNEISSRLMQKRWNVFLVGAGQDVSESLREPIRKEIVFSRYFKPFDVYYPEELFEELLGSGNNFDLLTLENLLAKSVHAVVIILESPGAIAELGAFANHRSFRDKLIVVVNKKYKKHKSFILLGPIRFLSKKTKSKIIFIDFKNLDIIDLGTKIRKAVKEIGLNVEIEYSVKNPLFAQDFILATLYLIEPVSKERLKEMIKLAGVGNFRAIDAIITASLNILMREKEIILKDGYYSLTEEGKTRILSTIKQSPEKRKIENLLDKLRIKLLNSRLRGNNFRRIKERAI